MSLHQVIGEVFPRRPGIIADLVQRQADYDQAQFLIEHTSLALGELEKQRAALASIDPGVDPEPKRLRLGRQIGALNEFLAKLQRISEPTEQYIISEIIRAGEQQ